MSQALPVSPVATVVRQRLSAALNSPLVTALPELCRRAEDEVQTILTDQILDIVKGLAGFEDLTLLTPIRFRTTSGIWECRISPALTEDTIVIAVVRLDPPSQERLRTERYSLHALSRYKDCQLKLDPCLWTLHETIGSMVQDVFEATSLWLNAFVAEGLRYLTDDIAEALNNHLRAILPAAVADQVQLYALTDEEGLYLTDEVLRQAAIRRASVRSKLRNLSPIEAIADFSSRILDAKTLVFSAQALREDTTVQAALITADYDSDFILAEEAVYSTGTILVQPLVREGKTRLVAGYPASLQVEYPDLRALLTQERKTLFEIVSTRGSKLKRTIRLMQREPLFRIGAGQLGEFLAGILKELARR